MVKPGASSPLTHSHVHSRAAEHDHAACIVEAVRNAADVCAKRGLNLTPVRRRILEIVWRTHEPIRAYDILNELAKEREKAAPPTVYRALEFLIDVGLVHRIDSLNAFIGCDEAARTNVAQFLVCQRCHRVAQIDDPEINKLLVGKSLAAGFRIEPTLLEIKGLCGECKASHVGRIYSVGGDKPDPDDQKHDTYNASAADQMLRKSE